MKYPGAHPGNHLQCPQKEISRRLSVDFLLPQETIAVRIRRTIDGYRDGAIVASLEILMALSRELATRVCIKLLIAHSHSDARLCRTIHGIS